jgi:glycosyltransferase involved in cell wall biosynthesis
MVGRLLREKGVREFVEAAEMVTRSVAARFLLAGAPDPGNPSSIDPAVIEAWHRQGRVSFLGHREDIRDLLRDADLVVLPSYREGAPLSLIEAAACGLPLIATDVPGCREIVLHNVNGLLVPPRHVKELADAILALLQDDKRRVAMGRRSRSLACELFSQERVVRETLNIYAKALGR